MKLLADNREYLMEYINKIIHGDCLEKLKELPDNSVDSIVTDPPAGISFMGKSWDTDKGGRDNWIKWMQEVATECKRVLKPGGHAFVWVIPRTSHWTATAWENAGFEIRDVVAHVFGSGFPKSHNVEKAVQKIQPERSNEFKGIGTALKPAREDWILMRKPLAEKTVAENCLKYGTGGINIDESRVDFISEEDRKESTTKNQHADFGTKPMINNNVYGDYSMIQPKNFNPTGRFPANLILSDCEEVRECFPETTTNGVKTPFVGSASKKINLGGGNVKPYETNSGNASRFFKSIKKDLQYSQKHAILKLCENNINVNNAGNNLTTTSQIELVANIFSALKSATPNLDLLNQNLNALFVEKNADSTEIDFVAKCVAIKEIPEGLVSQQEYTVFLDFMGDYKKCSQTQNLVNVEKWDNTDITQIMISLLKLCGYVLLATEENINSENREEQKCEYKSLVYIPKASKSERNKGCEGLEEKETKRYGDFEGTDEHSPKLNVKNTNNHPTVKPIALMEYLIKMVTPKGGIVLDPFAGSGSTLVAAKQNGYQYIGIEMTEEYIPIINARLGL